MITRAELTEIGRAIKPHGINGEIATAINQEVDFGGLRCIVMDIDGIFVPFFIDSVRQRGSESVLVTIDGINDEKDAKELCGKTVYALKNDPALISDRLDSDNDDSDEGFYAEDLIGFKVATDDKTIGEITDVDSSTDNLLFIITDKNGNTSYIPVADEFITGIDMETHIITMSLPEGLLEL